jgi:hypothetical protein
MYEVEVTFSLTFPLKTCGRLCALSLCTIGTYLKQRTTSIRNISTCHGEPGAREKIGHLRLVALFVKPHSVKQMGNILGA